MILRSRPVCFGWRYPPPGLCLAGDGALLPKPQRRPCRHPRTCSFPCYKIFWILFPLSNAGHNIYMINECDLIWSPDDPAQSACPFWSKVSPPPPLATFSPGMGPFCQNFHVASAGLLWLSAFLVIKCFEVCWSWNAGHCYYNLTVFF